MYPTILTAAIHNCRADEALYHGMACGPGLRLLCFKPIKLDFVIVIESHSSCVEGFNKYI